MISKSLCIPSLTEHSHWQSQKEQCASQAGVAHPEEEVEDYRGGEWCCYHGDFIMLVFPSFYKLSFELGDPFKTLISQVWATAFKYSFLCQQRRLLGVINSPSTNQMWKNQSAINCRHTQKNIINCMKLQPPKVGHWVKKTLDLSIKWTRYYTCYYVS